MDVGTSSVRVAAVEADGRASHSLRTTMPPATPSPGLVELDARATAHAVVEMASEVVGAAGPVAAVGIANQRSSTVLWDRSTGEPLGPGLGWQDLRTVGRCLELQGAGLHLSPSQSATKLAHLLDTHDPDRSRDLCFGTIDTWLTWTLSQGEVHVTDASNAALTGLVHLDGTAWDPAVLEELRIPPSVLPQIVDSTGIVAEATILGGAPPIAGLLGDQQASLLGQGCTSVGQVKVTFGSGAMLDVVVGADRPGFPRRGEGGTFPVVAWQLGGRITWGLEAVTLSAGSCIDWLRDGLGLISDAAESHEVAALCESTEGVVFVPALFGIGTPHWDYGARGALLGVTRGAGRPQVVRAVLEGVAHRGADLLTAAREDAAATGANVADVIRVDGGMSRNPTFVQAFADATGCVVETSPVVEATTSGAAFAAGMAVGALAGLDDVAGTWEPEAVYEPGTPLDRELWARAVERAREWYPELSALDF